MFYPGKILLSFIALVAPLFCFSQDQLFETTIRSRSSSPASIVDYFGKGWIVVGTAGYCASGYIAMFDLDGKLKWKNGGPMWYGEYNDVALSPNGEIVAVGYDIGGDDYAPFIRFYIVMYDSLGNQLDYFYYPSDTMFGINGSSIYTGFKQVASNNQRIFVSIDSTLVAINQSRDTVWTRKLNSRITSIEVFDELLMVGTSTNIFKIDTSGNLLKTGGLGTIVASAKTHDNHLLYLTTSSFTTSKVYKLDTLLNILAVSPLPIAMDHAYDITAGKNNYFILGEQSSGYPYVLQYGTNLNIDSSQSYTIENEDLNPVGIAANDSIFVVTGRETTFNTSRIFAKSFDYHSSQTLVGKNDVGVTNARVDNFSAELSQSFLENIYTVRFSLYATVKNFGSDTINSFCINSNFLEGVNCAHNMVFKCFDNILLPPGVSLEVDLGITTIYIFHANRYLNMCLYTSNPNDGIDINYNNDRFCGDLYYFVGIEPTENLIISIYPNPAFSYINVESNSAESTYLKLYDLTGQNVINKRLTNNLERIKVEQLNSGIYLYQVSTDESVLKTGKIIIE